MKYSYTLIKADYLQRTRSYSFLITLAITVYAAYSFVPPPNAAYTTLNVTGYRGAFNSAWVGYVSATMTAVMLSLYGFLLVNNGIKKDIDTEVGLIIATTPITNFGYLLIKLFSNFLVLLTIAGITFVVSMVMFWVRGSGAYPFIFADFIMPYVMFALPALFVVSGLAVVAEVFLGKRSILQFIIYFFICGAVMAGINKPETGIPTAAFDPFGLSLVTGSIKSQINTEFHENIKQVSFGFIFGNHKSRTFEWNGVNWTAIFILSRLAWIAFSLALVYLSSFFFHRFDFNQSISKKKKVVGSDQQTRSTDIKPAAIHTGPLPAIVIDYGIFPFIKTELLLLIRKGAIWFWFVTGGVWVAMLFAPLDIAHLYLLPIIWFLQVTRLSDLVTKERSNGLHYFTYSSYKPLLRMLPAQILAGVLLAVALALPLIGRYLIDLNFYAVLTIICGAIFIVVLAACLGIVSGGKKLFEVIFFMLTYAATQKIPAIDYLGATPHQNHTGYTAVIGMLIILLGSISFFVRNYQARHL